MPAIRKSALTWSPLDNGPIMMNLIKVWLEILPHWIFENLLDQILIPRIKLDVELWNPITDHVPIDSWLLPWRSLMGDRLLSVYPIIRQKLAKGLHNWIPGDRSAFESIRPWKDVFSAGTMSAFLGMNIVPKLERALQSIDINTTEQFEYLEFFRWTELINNDIVTHILVNNFFPRFYENLCYQLNALNISYEGIQSIKKEYLKWKSLLPPAIASQPLVVAELKRALSVISQTQCRILGTPVPSIIHRLTSPASNMPTPTHYAAAPSAPTTFRQLVEQRANLSGILFCPQPNKYYEGKQVYSFGNHSIYFDGTIMFLYGITRRQWTPIGLETLISLT